MSKDTISRERLEAPPGTIYAETILEPSHLFMLEHYFSPLASTNKAWTVMLVETGIVDEDRGAALLDAILDLEAAGPEAIGDFDPRYEYFYSHVERFLTERIGEEIAGEINIARTRPEPLTRLLLRSRLLDLCDALAGFCGNLLTLAEREADTVMPQWTHFQPAQISTLGHYLVGIENLLARDFDRLRAAYRTTNRCTLGCGALAGTSYPIDRQLVSDLLGFDGFQENTIDCVAAADYVLETATATAGLMVSLSRLCQDLWIWHTEEFGFIEIGDDYAGSSSMMPQKKNAYVFEFVRARAAHAIGDAAAALGTLRAANFQDLKDVEEEVVTPVVRSLRRSGSGTAASRRIDPIDADQPRADARARKPELRHGDRARRGYPPTGRPLLSHCAPGRRKPRAPRLASWEGRARHRPRAFERVGARPARPRARDRRRHVPDGARPRRVCRRACRDGRTRPQRCT